MITSSREKDFEAKAEEDTNNNTKLNKAPSSSRQWSAFKNPRIVRVSRAFGGKDRHSKVCTVRGLRDRRIRLSVPTAIQLYDLQDRLGLSQPSKVVDWLLDATKHDIDKLPPLQMPPGNFSQFQQYSPQSSFSPFFNLNPPYAKEGGTQSLLPNKEGIKINYNAEDDQNLMIGKSKAWVSDSTMGGKLKGVDNVEKSSKWMRTNEEENQDGNGGNYIPQVSAQNFFPVAANSIPPFTSLLNSPVPNYNYYHWDPSNLSLSQFGIGSSHAFPPQTEAANTSNFMSIPSGSQLFLCPPTGTPSVFPPYPPFIAALGSGENDTRQINHFPLLSSSSSQHSLPNPLMSSLHSFSSPMSASSKVHLQSQSQNDERRTNKGGSDS
ncbi:hypothetical protein U1Q18_027661 [Sarracenia purpurea var. burkii]